MKQNMFLNKSKNLEIKKSLEKLLKKLINIPITFNNNKDCALIFTPYPYININFDEINDLIEYKHNMLKNRKHNIKYLPLIILLHEIAHYKQYLKYSDVTQYLIYYRSNINKYENTADRYARIYYKRFLDKKGNICYD